MPNFESTAVRAATLWPFVYSGERDAERALNDSAVEAGELEPLLEMPGRLHLQFADETLIP